MNEVTVRRVVEDRSLRGSTVLVVDDEPESLELLRVLLVSQGYRVVASESSEAAMAVLAREPVDLVVCDLMMSRMDGVELCAHVRSALGLHLPIVFVTSLHDRASRIRAKEAGADDFLVKPVDGLELLVRVESLLATRSRTAQAVRERNQLLVGLSAVCASLGQAPVAGESQEPGAVAELASQRTAIEGLLAELRSAAAPSGVVERTQSLLSRALDLEQRLRSVLEDAERVVREAARGGRSADAL